MLPLLFGTKLFLDVGRDYKVGLGTKSGIKLNVNDFSRLLSDACRLFVGLLRSIAFDVRLEPLTIVLGILCIDKL